MRPIGMIAVWISLITASPAASQGWSPDPWLLDLAQMQYAFSTKYVNLDWLEHDRGVHLNDLFEKAASRLHTAKSNEEAKAIVKRLIERVGDGHVSIEWPRPATFRQTAMIETPTPHDTCDELGFDEARNSPGLGRSLSGYHPVGEPSPFPAGIVQAGGRSIGVLRIGGFEPQISPPICRAALQALHLTGNRPCDDRCQDAVLTWSYNRITDILEQQVHALQAAGAEVLLVDITGNGGGTEWAEAAARILSPKSLASEARGFVRGPHWTAQWSALARQLRQRAASADARDRERLLQWQATAEHARAVAEQPCLNKQACILVARAGYATGLVGRARAGEFAGKSWADLVFGIAKFPYHDGVWSGPLIVLVDDQTWSAAEEFAAVLQDNDAAVILGTRTGGAGCGHTNGGTPTILANSGAILELPDCVRFRADGSNEVAGVVPDVLTGIRANDGAAFKTKLVEARLPDATRMAIDMTSR